MPRKTAKSDLQTPLGRSGMSGAIHPHLGFQPVQKTPTIHASSGFIWKIPAKMKFASEAGDIFLLLGFLIWQINQE